MAIPKINFLDPAEKKAFTFTQQNRLKRAKAFIPAAPAPSRRGLSLTQKASVLGAGAQMLTDVFKSWSTPTPTFSAPKFNFQYQTPHLKLPTFQAPQYKFNNTPFQKFFIQASRLPGVSAADVAMQLQQTQPLTQEQIQQESVNWWIKQDWKTLSDVNAAQDLYDPLLEVPTIKDDYVMEAQPNVGEFVPTAAELARVYPSAQDIVNQQLSYTDVLNAQPTVQDIQNAYQLRLDQFPPIDPNAGMDQIEAFRQRGYLADVESAAMLGAMTSGATAGASTGIGVGGIPGALVGSAIGVLGGILSGLGASNAQQNAREAHLDAVNRAELQRQMAVKQAQRQRDEAIQKHLKALNEAEELAFQQRERSIGQALGLREKYIQSDRQYLREELTRNLEDRRVELQRLKEEQNRNFREEERRAKANIEAQKQGRKEIVQTAAEQRRQAETARKFAQTQAKIKVLNAHQKEIERIDKARREMRDKQQTFARAERKAQLAQEWSAFQREADSFDIKADQEILANASQMAEAQASYFQKVYGGAGDTTALNSGTSTAPEVVSAMAATSLGGNTRFVAEKMLRASRVASLLGAELSAAEESSTQYNQFLEEITNAIDAFEDLA